MFKRKDAEIENEFQIENKKVEATIELQKMDSTNTAKEVASKFLGKYGIVAVVMLVVIVVIASAFLEAGSLAVVIGLVSSVVMAVISMLQGITGTKDKESNPMADALGKSLDQNSEMMNRQNELMFEMLKGSNDSMHVDVEDGKVKVKKGDSQITTK